ncbi:MAG TPA: DUF3592 domain-containing protein [Pseudonocardiaceae bacterium]|nr:DUF3592 domain-containing protein [Pseudonocardiaceae bacterium]
MIVKVLVTGYGLIFLGGLFTVGIGRGFFQKVLPQIRVVRNGHLADGKMLGMQLPVQAGYRTQRPVLQFVAPDGKNIRFQDLNAQNCKKQPGDPVTVRYDPADPKRTATILDMRDALRYARTVIISLLVCLAIVAVGVLIVIGVITF